MPRSSMHSFTLFSMTPLATLPTRYRFLVQTISSVRYSVEFLAAAVEVADTVAEVAILAAVVIRVGAAIRAAVAAVTHVEEETVEMIMNSRIVTFASWPTIRVVVNTVPRRSRICLRHLPMLLKNSDVNTASATTQRIPVSLVSAVK